MTERARFPCARCGPGMCVVSAVSVVAVCTAKRAVSAHVLLLESEDTCIQQISKPEEKCNSSGDGRGSEYVL